MSVLLLLLLPPLLLLLHHTLHYVAHGRQYDGVRVGAAAVAQYGAARCSTCFAAVAIMCRRPSLPP